MNCSLSLIKPPVIIDASVGFICFTFSMALSGSRDPVLVLLERLSKAMTISLLLWAAITKLISIATSLVGNVHLTYLIGLRKAYGAYESILAAAIYATSLVTKPRFRSYTVIAPLSARSLEASAS